MFDIMSLSLCLSASLMIWFFPVAPDALLVDGWKFIACTKSSCGSVLAVMFDGCVCSDDCGICTTTVDGFVAVPLMPPLIFVLDMVVSFRFN